MDALAFAEMHRNPAYQINVFGTTLNNVIAAMSTLSGNTVTGGVEHRGLYHTDKRFTLYTGIDFIGKTPVCSLYKLLDCKKEAAAAVKGRKHSYHKITAADYMRSLVVRCLRGQILNPIIRFDLATKLLEKLRKSAMNNKFVRQAIKPENAQSAASLIIFN
tara:strand:+ start:759 stop:1241 length:483 start_codon:yes stop_codon:yes gene_type:complete